jgi:hypothetical protein
MLARIGGEFAEQRIERRGMDEAFGNFENAIVATRLMKAEDDLALRTFAEAVLHLVAVVPYLRRDENRPQRRKLIEAAEMLERLRDLSLLPFELQGVGQVLPAATAANTEQGAWSLDAVGRGRFDFLQPGLGMILLLPHDPGAHPVTRKRARHEDDESLGLGDARAAIGKAFDLEAVNGLFVERRHLLGRLRGRPLLARLNPLASLFEVHALLFQLRHARIVGRGRLPAIALSPATSAAAAGPRFMQDASW